MGRIHIVADSTCDLSEEIINRYQLSILPLNIIMDDQSYLDGVEIQPKEIFLWAEKNKTTPKTAAPSIKAAIDLFTPMKEAGEEAVFFGISEQMSSTCQVVLLAAEELSYKEHIKVVDSRNLSSGIGLSVIRAAELAEKGSSLQEIVTEISEYRERVRASFIVDTLTYLQRGGRCSAVTALLGNTLKLKPRISVVNGKMGVSKKYRGNRKKTVLSYVKDMEEDFRHAETDRVFITYSTIEKEIVDEVEDYLKSLSLFKEIFRTDAGGVISSHCGPGTLGVLFVEKK